jgi:hypothetical protein
MKLLALVKGPASIARYLATVGEAAEVPQRSPGRGPPYWKSRVPTPQGSRVGATEPVPGSGRAKVQGAMEGPEGRGWQPPKTRLDWPIALVSPTLFSPSQTRSRDATLGWCVAWKALPSSRWRSSQPEPRVSRRAITSSSRSSTTSTRATRSFTWQPPHMQGTSRRPSSRLAQMFAHATVAAPNRSDLGDALDKCSAKVWDATPRRASSCSRPIPMPKAPLPDRGRRCSKDCRLRCRSR